MFDVLKNLLALMIIVSMARSGGASSRDEITEMLARAEALYYAADFPKSVELLLRADEMLKRQPGHEEQKPDVKLRLALSFIGLNDNDRAKTYLKELYALVPDYRVDPQMYSPKVIRLAEDARAEQEQNRCRSLTEDAEKQFQAGNVDAIVQLIRSSHSKCSNLAEFNPRAADLVFKQGVEAYKNTRMTEALQKFRTALELEPKHELASQYADLTSGKLEVTADRALLAWRKDFTAGNFADAAQDYHELASVSSSSTLEDVKTDYRQALTTLVEAYNEACARHNSADLEKLRGQIDALLPEPSFGEDILANLKTCSATACVQMTSQAILTRLVFRVDPQFTAEVKSQVRVSPIVVTLKAMISEKGDVTVRGFEAGNAALYSGVRKAVERWKFEPLVVDGQARCVDADIRIRVNF